jgi:hypothetical protein
MSCIMGLANEDTKPSPEIKRLVEKLAPADVTGTIQAKYEAILQRKSYDHHCFMECVRLRLEPQRGMQTTCNVQNTADNVFTHMLTHST